MGRRKFVLCHRKNEKSYALHLRISAASHAAFSNLKLCAVIPTFRWHLITYLFFSVFFCFVFQRLCMYLQN